MQHFIQSVQASDYVSSDLGIGFGNFESSMSGKNWAEEYTDEQIFSRGFFKKIAVKDFPITDEEMAKRLAKLTEPLPLVARQQNPFRFPVTVMPMPYKISAEMKAELLSKTTKTEAFSDKVVLKHIPTDKDQEMQPDTPLVLEKRDAIDHPPEDMWETAQWLSTCTVAEKDKKIWEAIRNPHVKLFDWKMNSVEAAKKVQQARVKFIVTGATLKRKYDIASREAWKKRWDDVIRDIEEVVAWLPENSSILPALKDGGYKFREWKKELEELHELVTGTSLIPGDGDGTPPLSIDGSLS